jgi:hypothetical protein
MKESRSLEVGIRTSSILLCSPGQVRVVTWAVFFRRFAARRVLVQGYSLPFLKVRTGRGIDAIFTGALHSRNSFASFVHQNQFSENRYWVRLLAKVNPGAAPFPVSGLWTACTRLKIHVLTNAYFSLTEKIEGVQQDRSLTAS